MELTEVVLHPVRMRILRRFLGDRRLTTAELGDELGDVPPASLYRHVRLLAEHGVLAVAEERAARGAIERTYVLAGGDLGPDEARSITPDRLRTGFLTFLAGLAEDLDRYLEAGEIDPVADRIGFREVGLHLRDDEVDELIATMSEVVLRFVGRPREDGRSLRVLGSVLLPRSEPAVG